MRSQADAKVFKTFPNSNANGWGRIVILVETETGTSVAKKILEQFKLPFNFNEYEAIVEASIGITSPVQ